MSGAAMHRLEEWLPPAIRCLLAYRRRDRTRLTGPLANYPAVSAARGTGTVGQPFWRYSQSARGSDEQQSRFRGRSGRPGDGVRWCAGRTPRFAQPVRLAACARAVRHAGARGAAAWGGGRDRRDLVCGKRRRLGFHGQRHTGAVARSGSIGQFFVTTVSREALDIIDRQSPQITAWGREPEANACPWCEDVSTIVFDSAVAADIGHDNCHCSIEPA